MSDTLSISTLAPVDQAGYAALVTGAAILSRPAAGVLRLSDADRHDFLQRMTTNNIAILRPGQSVVTVLTSPTARNLFVFTVIARNDDLLLLPALGQSQALVRHLRGQIFFMDKVKVQDLSDQWSRLRLMGAKAVETLAVLGVDGPALGANAVSMQDDLLVMAQPQFEVPGFEIVATNEKLAEVNQVLLASGALAISEELFQARRVELGRPAAGAELVDEYTPLEAGL